MAFSQIATSVTILNSGQIGYIGISLTNFTTSAASNIASGSGVEIAGAWFKADSDIIPNSSSWTAITTATTAYLALTPSGTAGSQVITASWISTLPSWDTAKQGWYTTTPSNIRVVASAYKGGTSSYWQKRLINYGQSDNFAIGTIQMFDGFGWVDNITIPGWYACTTANSVYGCPALTNKFIMGALAPGATGGSNLHTLTTDELPPHTHTYIQLDTPGSYIYVKGTSSAGTAYTGDGGFANTAIDIRPSYYSVIYIRKCY
jgi:hypothetical protein